MSKSEQNTESVLALRDLLRTIISKPQNYSDEESLLLSLKSQGRSAGLEFTFKDGNGDRHIFPISLNTQKSYADKFLTSGYDGLNKLRQGAVDSILAYKARKDKPNKRTKEGLKLAVSDLEDDILSQRKINMILLQGLSSAMSSITSVRDAHNKDTRIKRAEDGLNKLRAIISLNPPDFDKLNEESTVVNLADYRYDD
ncbi:MAG: hypothetical protein LC539_16970 [Candidatus Thiodiazotropha sp.]|nr:hypothetical protein [Candidatus Thiodiazotropha sp.]